MPNKYNSNSIGIHYTVATTALDAGSAARDSGTSGKSGFGPALRGTGGLLMCGVKGLGPLG